MVCFEQEKTRQTLTGSFNLNVYLLIKNYMYIYHIMYNILTLDLTVDMIYYHLRIVLLLLVILSLYYPN